VTRARLFQIFGVAVLLGIPLYVVLTGSATPPAHPQTVAGRVFNFLDRQQFALLFLVVTGGQLLGRLKFKGIGIGATGATMILALELSVWAVAGEGIRLQIASFASTIFFNLFMFAVGLKVGPQFMSGMRRDGIKFIVIAVMIPAISFLLVMLIDRQFHLKPGQAPGILAGANTATPGLGAAEDAFTSGATTTKDIQAALGNLSTAFAFSYSMTMVLFVLMLKLLPGLFRKDARSAAQGYIVAGNVPLPGDALALMVGTLPVATRSYRVEGADLVGHSLGEMRRQVPMLAIEKVLRSGQVLDPDDQIQLQRGDVVGIFGSVSRLLAFSGRVGPEVDAPELRETRRETADLVVDGRVAGKKLGDLAEDVGHGVFLNAMFRGGESVPFGLDVVVEKGDVLRVTAGQNRLARLNREAGVLVRSSLVTDVVTLGIGLSVGALLGALAFPLGPVRMTLGPSVGLLLIGIGLGTLRTRFPQLGGPFPEPARKLLEDLGLSVFVAILGLTSGASVIASLLSGGVVVIIIGALIVGLLPPLIAWVVGLYVLRMNTALLLGAVAGGSASAAALNAAQEVSASTVPAIAYPVAFAISNILFTLLSYISASFG